MIFLEINKWSDMDEIEFGLEKFGMDPVEPEQRYFGWITDENAANTPEELAHLDRIYNEIDRQSLPASYDSRAKGNKDVLVTKFKNSQKLDHSTIFKSRICHQC